MRKWMFSLVGVALLLAAVPPSNQAMDYATLLANQSGNFTWATAAPTGSTELVTAARYRALVQTTACPQATATGSQIVDWNFVISCAGGSTPRPSSPQSQSISGNYSTVYYTAYYNAKYGTYSCRPQGSDAYTGTPVTLPAGTVAPGASTPLSINLTSITYPGTTTQLTVTLKNPSGVTVQTWTINAPNSSFSASYTAAGAAGSWTWNFAQTGGTDGTCNAATGASGGGTQVTWSGSVGWYQ